jgi:hypothetical protein
MSPFIRKALRKGLLTFNEAQLWEATTQVGSHLEEIVLPENLFSVAEKLWLWEQPSRRH